MSTTSATPAEDPQTVVQRIESYLCNLSDDLNYMRSKEIASEIGLPTRQVASLLSRVDEQSDRVEINKWARTTSTTWQVKITA